MPILKVEEGSKGFSFCSCNSETFHRSVKRQREGIWELGLSPQREAKAKQKGASEQNGSKQHTHASDVQGGEGRAAAALGEEVR